MKNLKTLFSVLLLSVFALSCSSSSDDNSIKVKYQINGIDDSVTQVSYKDGDGNIFSVSRSEFAGSGDSKTIKVSPDDLPFNAQMNVSVNNTTPNVKEYTLAIYVDGVGKALTNFSSPPNATSSSLISYNVTE